MTMVCQNDINIVYNREINGAEGFLTVTSRPYQQRSARTYYKIFLFMRMLHVFQSILINTIHISTFCGKRSFLDSPSLWMRLLNDVFHFSVSTGETLILGEE